MEDKIKNKIIALSGQPVTGKGTTVKSLIEKLKTQGYKEENIHVISTGNEFRNYFNKVISLIKNLDDTTEVGDLVQKEEIKDIIKNKEYREVFLNTVLALKNKKIDIANLSIEEANNLKELKGIRKVIDTLIDQNIRKKGIEIKINEENKQKEIARQKELKNNNKKEPPDEIWIFDSRLAFHNIPEAFAVRLISKPEVAAERLFNDKSRGKEDSAYASVEEAKEARENRRIGEQKRYLQRYGVDLENENNYDLIIDTSYSKIEDISDTILDCLDYYEGEKYFSKKWTSPKTLLPLQRERDTLGMGTANTIDSIIESIRKKGYLPEETIEIIEVDRIKYIIEGHHRNFGAAYLGKTLVPYEVIAKDDEEIPMWGNTARNRAKSLKLSNLTGHEWMIEKGEEGNFSYNDIYPGIYDKLRQLEGEEH